VSVSQAGVVLSAQDAQVLGLLLPHLAAVVVEGAEIGEDLVVIRVRGRAGGASCPWCGRWSARVHDGYVRRLADAGIGGRRVVAWLRVRRLKCGNGGCPKRTFAEQPAGLASWRARKTPLLAAALAGVVSVLAARPAAALAGRVLAVEVSRDTLGRVLMGLPGPAAGLVRVLGVDDFSLRKGARYATLLVDMETGRPVEVLPDREAATLAAWLAEHPQVEVVCRDRAGAYAQAVRDGAPQAIEVADRWHLWHNLCEHAARAAARHQGCLAQAGCACRDQDQDRERDRDRDRDRERDREAAGEGEQGQQQPPGELPAGLAAGELPAGLAAVIRERHRAVHELRAAGTTLAGTAAALGLSPQLTGRFWRAADPGQLLAARPAAALEPYKAYLQQRWDQGITSIAVLHREITALGCPASYTTTYAWLALLKLAAPPAAPAPPAPQQAARWMLTDPARLDSGQHAQLAAILDRCPELGDLARHITSFATLLTCRPGTGLDDWLTTVEASPGQPELRSFAHGIRRDYQAVTNALTLSWSSGLVEGLNTRTKLLQRQMYGRASFPLQRKRILLTS
jgi:transposase